MSGIAALWRRAPLWRLALLGAVAFSVLSFWYSPRSATANLSAQSSRAPQSAADEVPAGDLLACVEEHHLSSAAGPRIPVRFENGTIEPVSLYWLDNVGHRKMYATVKPGKSLVQQASPTSYWVIADGHEACVGIVHPGRNTQEILIHGSAGNVGLAALH